MGKSGLKDAGREKVMMRRCADPREMSINNRMQTASITCTGGEAKKMVEVNVWSIEMAWRWMVVRERRG